MGHYFSDRASETIFEMAIWNKKRLKTIHIYNIKPISRCIYENLICNHRVNNTMSAEQSSKTAERQNVRKCEICGKSFESEDMLNYHKLLEHSEHKRPPIGIG
ncbi:MAG TPA: hypothetical protein VJS91_11320 [Nitrososphaeraceae archaeon]|nr:hypothetical protein [Nitrososphaeraceae archaeon]